MHEWPNAGEPDPAAGIKRAALDAGGVLELTAGELGARFGVQRLTKTARERMAADLRAAGLAVEPDVEQAQRGERLRVALQERDIAPAVPWPVTAAATPAAAARVAPAAAPGRRRQWRGWVVGVAVAVLALIALTSGGDDEVPEQRPSVNADVAASPTATPTARAATTPDPVAVARRRAKALGRGGKYSAALEVLNRAGDRSGLARRLRRRGSRALLTQARRELAAGHEGAARTYARRARRLGAVAAAGALIRTADAQAAAERAEAEERRRLAAIARDQRTCSMTEKNAVDDGAPTPPGCDTYAAQVADDAAAEPSSSGCDPNYSGACLDPDASDYDCAGGSGDGPEFTGPVEVVGDDHYDLNADPEEDSTGCEEE